MTDTIYIVSGEGTQGTRDPYTGAATERALKSRLTRERASGDRWAHLEVAYDGDDSQRECIGVVDAVRLLRRGTR